jgi:regulator of RNase E activity RraA
VVGDGDGVIVIPRDLAASAVAATRKRAEDERVAAKQIAAGATLWDLHGLGERYSSLGIPEIES